MRLLKKTAVIFLVLTVVISFTTGCSGNKLSMSSINDFVPVENGIASTITVNFTRTLFRSADTLVILIDDQAIGQLTAGVKRTYDIKLSQGKHTFKVAKNAEDWVKVKSETLTFNTVEDGGDVYGIIGNTHAFEVHVNFFSSKFEVKDIGIYDRVQ